MPCNPHSNLRGLPSASTATCSIVEFGVVREYLQDMGQECMGSSVARLLDSRCHGRMTYSRRPSSRVWQMLLPHTPPLASITRSGCGLESAPELTYTPKATCPLAFHKTCASNWSITAPTSTASTRLRLKVGPMLCDITFPCKCGPPGRPSASGRPAADISWSALGILPPLRW